MATSENVIAQRRLLDDLLDYSSHHFVKLDHWTSRTLFLFAHLPYNRTLKNAFSLFQFHFHYCFLPIPLSLSLIDFLPSFSSFVFTDNHVFPNEP